MISSFGLFSGSLALAKVTQGLSVEVLAKEADAANVYSQPIGSRMEFFARKFLGTPYVGFTLDQIRKRRSAPCSSLAWIALPLWKRC